MRRLSYLCPSYKAFFTHIDPYMRTMAALVNRRMPAAGIMDSLAAKEKRLIAASSGRHPAPSRAPRLRL
jgi:hypothetical protein